LGWPHSTISRDGHSWENVSKAQGRCRHRVVSLARDQSRGRLPPAWMTPGVTLCRPTIASRRRAALTILVLEVFRLNGWLLAAGNHLTRPVHQSSARWQVVGAIDHAPMTVSQIARAMGLTRQSVQRTADRPPCRAPDYNSYANTARHPFEPGAAVRFTRPPDRLLKEGSASASLRRRRSRERSRGASSPPGTATWFAPRV
jgi:MarR family